MVKRKGKPDIEQVHDTLRQLLTKIEKLEEQLLKQPTEIRIEHVHVERPVLEQLSFHLDEIDIEELSGSLNMGNNFGIDSSAVHRSKPHTKMQTTTREVSHSKAQTKAQTKAKTKAKTHVQQNAHTKAHTNAHLDIQPYLQTNAQEDVQSNTFTDSRTKVQTNGQRNTQSDVNRDAHNRTRSDAQTNSRTNSRINIQTDVHKHKDEPKRPKKDHLPLDIRSTSSGLSIRYPPHNRS